VFRGGDGAFGVGRRRFWVGVEASLDGVGGGECEGVCFSVKYVVL